ncbi:MAG TPA: hypothetical protein PK176_16935, partial [Acidobacteriota bacterium]|nr:hypothetical protein [Acidobacteriota bacterium]HQM65000.1 hypothetical protein [Acidobacteriota bacterium]
LLAPRRSAIAVTWPLRLRITITNTITNNEHERANAQPSTLNYQPSTLSDRGAAPVLTQQNMTGGSRDAVV